MAQRLEEIKKSDKLITKTSHMNKVRSPFWVWEVLVINSIKHGNSVLLEILLYNIHSRVSCLVAGRLNISDFQNENNLFILFKR